MCAGESVMYGWFLVVLKGSALVGERVVECLRSETALLARTYYDTGPDSGHVFGVDLECIRGVSGLSMWIWTVFEAQCWNDDVDLQCQRGVSGLSMWIWNESGARS